MLILCLVRVHEKIPKMLHFINVAEEYKELARAMHGRHLQEPGNKEDMNTLFDLLGGETSFRIPKKLGTVVKSPVGCTEFVWFVYNL